MTFGAQNLDDLLELEVDGEVLLETEIEECTDARSGITLRVEGEGADFDALMAYRDIYYTTQRAMVTQDVIPPGHYFMLGDNTQDSSDSREWKFTRFRVEDGRGGYAELRGNTRRGENPVNDLRTPGGRYVWLRDEWGERHHLEGPQNLGTEAAPFVPRDMIQGRALAVFWPISPGKDVYRLKWVR